MSDLQALKAHSRSREAQDRRVVQRRRDALVLILRHLVDNGYTDTYERLCSEANISLCKVDVADNISLLQVIQEFEEGYESRFGTRPKLVRGGNSEDAGRALPRGGGGSYGGHVPPPGVLCSAPPPAPLVSGKQPGSLNLDGPAVSGAMAARQRREAGRSNAEDIRKAEAAERRQRAMDSVKAPADVGLQRVGNVVVSAQGVAGVGNGVEQDSKAAPALQVAGAALGRAQSPGVPTESPGYGAGVDDDIEGYFNRRLLKPLPGHLRGDLAELSAHITRDIYMDNPNVRWEDIAGLDIAKRLLVEAVVQPIRYPQLFTGLLAPWKGVLLYGPPGTGKTLLAKAVATECKTTFFNVQASTIISKWRGDSEKLVRVLFELARYHAPSTIFLDEIDALMMARGGEGEHEASRRMKTELLIQMDGLVHSNALVFVLAATNLPWELDQAMLRRLEKRIFVPLPSLAARQHMFASLLAGRCTPDVDWSLMAAETEGYSGSDVAVVAKEAAMRPLRRLMSQLEVIDSTQQGKGVDQHMDNTRHTQELEPVSLADVHAALQVTKASARLHEAQYTKFNEDYGQSGS